MSDAPGARGAHNAGKCSTRERSERRKIWGAEPEPGTPDGAWNRNLEPVTDVTVPGWLWRALEPEPGTSRLGVVEPEPGTVTGV